MGNAAKTLWYIVSGSRYLYRVWPVRFIIGPKGYRLGGHLLTLVWAVGYIPRVRIAKMTGGLH